MKTKELLLVLPQSTEVIIRGAFQSGYGKDESRPNYYKGKVADISKDFKHNDKPIIGIFGWGEFGGCDLKSAYALDIAVGDFDE